MGFRQTDIEVHALECKVSLCHEGFSKCMPLLSILFVQSIQITRIWFFWIYFWIYYPVGLQKLKQLNNIYITHNIMFMKHLIAMKYLHNTNKSQYSYCLLPTYFKAGMCWHWQTLASSVNSSIDCIVLESRVYSLDSNNTAQLYAIRSWSHRQS